MESSQEENLKKLIICYFFFKYLRAKQSVEKWLDKAKHPNQENIEKKGEFSSMFEKAYEEQKDSLSPEDKKIYDEFLEILKQKGL